MADFASPYYPFTRVYTGHNTYRGTELIPNAILTYILDMPDAAGYQPMDDNNRPRVRLMKYLYYDGMSPLNEILPTPVQKKSLLFDPYNPVLNTSELQAKHPKGYRLYGQSYFGQSQPTAQTTVKIYMGRTVPKSPFQAELGVYFEILTNVTYEANTKSDAYARTFDMEQCILESLLGVSMVGVGSWNFDRTSHSDNGSRPIEDGGTNVGRLLHMSCTWMDNGGDAG